MRLEKTFWFWLDYPRQYYEKYGSRDTQLFWVEKIIFFDLSMDLIDDLSSSLSDERKLRMFKNWFRPNYWSEGVHENYPTQQFPNNQLSESNIQT